METKNEDTLILNDYLQPYAVHPGEILKAELKERKIKQKDFARQIGMEASHLSALIHGVRNVTATIASKRENGLGIPASLWMSLQGQYNLAKKPKSNGSAALVDGYRQTSEVATVLGDPVSDRYGNRKRVSLSLPASDYPLLLELAKKIGWNVFVE